MEMYSDYITYYFVYHEILKGHYLIDCENLCLIGITSTEKDLGLGIYFF